MGRHDKIFKFALESISFYIMTTEPPYPVRSLLDCAEEPFNRVFSLLVSINPATGFICV